LGYWAWRWKRKTPGRGLLLASLPVLLTILVAAPYWIWLHGRTGRWLFAPKIAMTQVHQEIMNRGVREHWPEKYGSSLFYERVKFGLNEEGHHLLSADAFKGLGLVPDDGSSAGAPAKEKIPGVTEHLAMVVLRNVKQIYLDTIKYGLVLPTLLLGFLALGIT